jgi:hypothetical protein
MKPIFYNSIDLIEQREDVPHAFKNMFKLFSKNMTLVDRTDKLAFPIEAKLLDNLVLPKFKPVARSYHEICLNRARKLMAYAKDNGQIITILYSGGVDSTLVLTSFLSVCSDDDLRSNLLVLLDDNSISENPNFYWNHVRKLNKAPSNFFPRYIGSPNHYIVSGECNDQLFGSAAGHKYSIRGVNMINMPAGPENIIPLMAQVMPMDEATRLYRLLDKVAKASPVGIDTVYKWFWWMNMALKWQNVYVRLASFAPPQQQANVKFEHNYTAFFSDQEFQLWSMNNSNRLIGETMSTYKYQCKQIIFDFTKDAVYNEKAKIGSLMKILLQKPSAVMIDDNMKFHSNFSEVELTMENDFV